MGRRRDQGAGSAGAGRADPWSAFVVAAAAVLFGAVVILGDIIGRQGIPVTSMLAVRFAVAAAVLAIILAGTGRQLRPAPGEGWRLALLGAAGYALESVLFFVAIGRGTAAAVTLLFFTYPVWVAVLSVVLGMGRPGWLVGGALAAAVAGAGLVVASSGGLDITATGIGFALAAAVAFSGYLVGADLWLKRTSSLAAAMWVSAAAAAALATYAAVSGGGRLPPDGPGWLLVTGMGALTAAAFFCLFLGLRRLGAVRSSIIAALEPVSTSLLAVWILGERLSEGVVAGGVLILAGAVAAGIARKGPEPQPGAP
ncbi:MAG TPA: DMT family transporter [Actinomycetota bacterium]|nr:DMT family transporter [Actinomycetota bacterium]